MFELNVPKLDDISTPEVVALFTISGSGSKFFQAYLNQYEQIYMIPAYPLVYFYPHWALWENQYKDDWNWNRIIELFCEKHASVIDTRKFPAPNGLTTLGKNKDEFLDIDEGEFKQHLFRLLDNQPIHRKFFYWRFIICMRCATGKT